MQVVFRLVLNVHQRSNHSANTFSKSLTQESSWYLNQWNWASSWQKSRFTDRPTCLFTRLESLAWSHQGFWYPSFCRKPNLWSLWYGGISRCGFPALLSWRKRKVETSLFFILPCLSKHSLSSRKSMKRSTTNYLHHNVKKQQQKNKWHMTPDTWHVKCHMWCMVGGEHSLKISASQLLQFGIDSVLTILNERMNQSINESQRCL